MSARADLWGGGGRIAARRLAGAELKGTLVMRDLRSQRARSIVGVGTWGRSGARTPATFALVTAMMLGAGWQPAAHAQSSGAAPRGAAELGPTPTNPTDSGFGTTQGVRPVDAAVMVTPPTIAAAPQPALALPPAAVLQTPALTVAAAAPSGGSARLALPSALQPQAGGWTIAQVIARALKSDAGMQAAQANVAVARASQLESGLQFLPSLNLSFRYTRLSEFTPVSLPFFDGARCVSSLADCQGNTQAYYQSLQLAPAILDQYALRGSISLPLSDIPLRLLRQYQAAGLTLEARRLDAQVTAAGVAQGAGEAFYEYLRAAGQVAVAQQSLDSASRRRDDLRRSVAAGVAPRAELLRLEATVADLERLQLLSRNGLALAEAQLRQRTHADSRESIVLGEALDAPVVLETDLSLLIRRALQQRPEIQSVERQAQALGLSRAALWASVLPSLSAAGNVDYANPNSRFFPQTAEFRTTWDVSLQLTFSPNQTALAAATMTRLGAQTQALLAQGRAVREGVEIEVRAQHNQVQAAQALIEVARSQLAAAEENHRMRSSRFGTGSATPTELREVETELLRARLGVINAHVDLRIALCRLQRVLGDLPGRAAATARGDRS